MRGTPGYFPLRDDLLDGSTEWDIWAFAAIILESDMEVNEYKEVMSERGSLQKAGKHIEQPGVSDELKRIIRGTILKGGKGDIMGLDEILELLKKV